ncbi:MAG: hypothetical protein ACKKL6_03515 [Candidatus Komeilibacteria bacterium]
MTKDRQAKRQQMTAIVSVFLAVIIIAWIMSLSFTLFNADKNKDEGSVQNLLANFEKSLENFNTELSSNDVNLSNVADSLKNKFNQEKQNVEIVETIKNKLETIKLDSWLEYAGENISFKYPADWILSTEDNMIKLGLEDNIYLTINKYSVEDLPDNINSLPLTEYLDEQINRDLGNITGYVAIDTNTELEMYEVDYKEDRDTGVIYWEKNELVYSLEYTLDEELDSIIKLIISNIK